MNTPDIDINLIESYFGLLKNLSPDGKLELIAKLSNSMKTTKASDKGNLNSLYGSFFSSRTADELIDDIKQARNFSRKRVEF